MAMGRVRYVPCPSLSLSRLHLLPLARQTSGHPIWPSPALRPPRTQPSLHTALPEICLPCTTAQPSNLPDQEYRPSPLPVLHNRSPRYEVPALRPLCNTRKPSPALRLPRTLPAQNPLAVHYNLALMPALQPACTTRNPSPDLLSSMTPPALHNHPLRHEVPALRPPCSTRNPSPTFA
ncbi:hypothetical protein MRB53_010658 [Persea americana]|uniref:Uncharacterized protein n=1 Tax=Persea americana TaxID=3435 RepID=A0ACC2LSP3_PERAE|nr:hypothetical protein MRB53_010658 [Persea americana]